MCRQNGTKDVIYTVEATDALPFYEYVRTAKSHFPVLDLRASRGGETYEIFCTERLAKFIAPSDLKRTE